MVRDSRTPLQRCSKRILEIGLNECINMDKTLRKQLRIIQEMYKDPRILAVINIAYQNAEVEIHFALDHNKNVINAISDALANKNPRAAGGVHNHF